MNLVVQVGNSKTKGSGDLFDFRDNNNNLVFKDTRQGFGVWGS